MEQKNLTLANNIDICCLINIFDSGDLYTLRIWHLLIRAYIDLIEIIENDFVYINNNIKISMLDIQSYIKDPSLLFEESFYSN